MHALIHRVLIGAMRALASTRAHTMMHVLQLFPLMPFGLKRDIVRVENTNDHTSISTHTSSVHGSGARGLTRVNHLRVPRPVTHL